MITLPRKEYIITEEQLQSFQRLGTFSNSFFQFVPILVNSIRSRPTLSPEVKTPDNYWYCPFRIGCEEGESWCSWPCDKWALWHDTAIRNAALDEVMEKIDYRFNDTERGRRTIETCREVIKSLRTKEQP